MFQNLQHKLDNLYPLAPTIYDQVEKGIRIRLLNKKIN